MVKGGLGCRRKDWSRCRVNLARGGASGVRED